MTYSQSTEETRQLVKSQWLLLIKQEGYENALRFLSECRERQISPSLHLDLDEFLHIGKHALMEAARQRIQQSTQVIIIDFSLFNF